MKKIKDSVFQTIVYGFKNLAPLLLTIASIRWIVIKVMDLLGASSSFAYSTEYLQNNPWMYLVLATVFIGLCLVFGIIFGASRDIYLDNFVGRIPIVNKLYSFFNGFFTFQKKAVKGSAVYIPYYHEKGLILCYIMGTSKILIHDVPHYRINIPPAAAIMGGHLVYMPCDYIDHLISTQQNSLPTSEEAYKTNLSIGASHPDRFKIHETQN